MSDVVTLTLTEEDLRRVVSYLCMAQIENAETIVRIADQVKPYDTGWSVVSRKWLDERSARR